MVELEDLVARHDYRLKPLLTKKCVCGRRNLNLLRAQGTIMSICDSCRKTYPINRECSYCHTIYEYDDLECKVCDVELTKLTEAEISVEDNQKLVRRSKRKLNKRVSVRRINCSLTSQVFPPHLFICGAMWIFTTTPVFVHIISLFLIIVLPAIFITVL